RFVRAASFSTRESARTSTHFGRSLGRRHPMHGARWERPIRASLRLWRRSPSLQNPIISIYQIRKLLVSIFSIFNSPSVHNSAGSECHSRRTPMIERRPFNQLAAADHGWLKARHHFSFGEFADPSRMGWGALRVWNDDEIASNTGFPPH